MEYTVARSKDPRSGRRLSVVLEVGSNCFMRLRYHPEWTGERSTFVIMDQSSYRISWSEYVVAGFSPRSGIA